MGFGMMFRMAEVNCGLGIGGWGNGVGIIFCFCFFGGIFILRKNVQDFTDYIHI